MDPNSGLEFAMSFMERARALYHRDDRVRAAFVLAEGIKRQPHDEEALNWFLQLYVEELDGPGLEQELLRVLETQPDGETLFEGIKAELARRQQPTRSAALTRVRSLRRRAEAVDIPARQVASPSGGPSALELDEDDPIRALEAAAAAGRRRRRRRARPVTEPIVPVGADDAGASAPPKPRRRRRRQRSDPSPQGVLQLETVERPPTDSWRGFQGVAAEVNPAQLPVPVMTSTDRHRPVVPAAPTSDGPRPRRRARRRQGSAGGDAMEATSASPVAVSPPEPLPASVDGGLALPPVDGGDLEPALALGSSAVDPRGEHAMTRAGEGGDVEETAGQALGVGQSSGETSDQLLPLAREDTWSFGDEPGAGTSMAQVSDPVQPTGRRIRRGHGRTLARASQALAEAGDGVRALGRGVRWASAGRRGPAVLGLVALLSVAGFGYRACTQFVDGQLAEADEALGLAQGETLRRAVERYAEHVDESAGAAREKLDFARALLRVDYGESAPALHYQSDLARSAYGLSALALQHVAGGNLPVARALGEEAIERFGEDWLAHWTRGRVAVADLNWERASEAFLRAAELDPLAVLPVLGQLDLALRAGRDEQVESAVQRLETISPGHPMIPVSRATVAFGVSPLEARVASLQTALPDPRETLISLRARELIAVLRARQALAAWQLDQVAQTMRGLREHHPTALGVRANLLDAALAARRYRLTDAIAALERSLNAAPEGSPATAEVRALAALIFADLGRPDLALDIVGEGGAAPVLRARLLVESGRESEALRDLGRLLDRPDTAVDALRILVDFHLRRGVRDRARMRAGGLNAEADSAYAAALLAADEGDWGAARDYADQALRLQPRDGQALAIWARAMAELGFAERGIERIDEHSARSILVGDYDRARLDVLVASGRAPRETLSEFAGLLESTQPTSMTRLAVLARAYESIGDLDRARQAAEQVVTSEHNNREMHALLGRIYHGQGDATTARTHLRAYLELAPETEPTDWARELLRTIDES